MSNGMEEKETGLELVGQETGILELARSADAYVEAIKKIKLASIKLTNTNDWVDQGGNPYLQSSGAEKVARAFGISWRFLEEPTKIPQEQNHYTYVVKMEFSIKTKSGPVMVEAMGTRSSKDEFFTTRYDKNRQKITLPVSEVDTGNVLKSAISNGISNGVTRLLGLRNITWEELQGAGININLIKKIPYQKGKPAPAPTTPTPEVKSKAEDISWPDFWIRVRTKLNLTDKQVHEFFGVGSLEEIVKTGISKIEILQKLSEFIKTKEESLLLEERDAEIDEIIKGISSV